MTHRELECENDRLKDEVSDLRAYLAHLESVLQVIKNNSVCGQLASPSTIRALDSAFPRVVKKPPIYRRKLRRLGYRPHHDL